MKKYFLPILCTVLAVSAAEAQAEENYPYISLSGGGTFFDDAEIDGGAVNSEFGLDAGWAVEGALGYRFTDHYRGELEVGYREMGVDSILNSTTAAGDIKAWSGMFNVLYDIFPQARFTPYIGAGAGIGMVSYEGVTPVNSTSLDDDEVVPLIQGIAGVSAKVSDQMDLFVNYQYVDSLAGDADYNLEDGTQVDVDYDGSTVLGGFRYAFVSSKPAQTYEREKPEPRRLTRKPPPLPKDTSRNYMVFFDFDSSMITTDARSVLRKVVRDIEIGNPVSVEVTGHTDRSGSDAYNVALSKRRAKAVQSELVKMGVDSGMIELRAKGESSPLVPTADGVREPQNRRAEIVYTTQ